LIEDSYGDGICCGVGEGGYILFNPDPEPVEKFFEGGEFEYAEEVYLGDCSDNILSIPIPYDDEVEDEYECS